MSELELSDLENFEGEIEEDEIDDEIDEDEIDEDEIDKVEDIDDIETIKENYDYDEEENDNLDIDDDNIDDDDENNELQLQMEIDDELNNQLNILSENIELIVHPDERITSNYLSKLEYSYVIGLRAEDISKGAPIYVDYKGLSDPIDIANKELYDNKFPISVKRHIGLNKYEIWDCNELIKKKYI